MCSNNYYGCSTFINVCYFYFYLACPIEGQIRKECASHPLCHLTCDDDGSRPCPAICIGNGCECPDGTVIDVIKRECVAPSECEGMLFIKNL